MTATARFTTGVIAILVVMALTLWATTLQATANGPASGGLVLQGENIVQYDVSDRPHLENAVQTIVQGIAIPGGCTFTIEMELGPDDAGMTARELAYDPDTCRSTFETGIKAGIPGASGGGMTYDEGGGTVATKARQFTGTWRDPVNLPVNWNRSRLKWKYDTGSGRVIEILHEDCLHYFYKTTQWRLSYDSGCTGVYANNDTQYWVYSSKEFDNDWFPCTSGRGATTRVFNHTIKGKGNGGVSTSTQMSKWGDCAGMLHAEVDTAHYNWPPR